MIFCNLILVHKPNGAGGGQFRGSWAKWARPMGLGSVGKNGRVAHAAKESVAQIAGASGSTNLCSLRWRKMIYNLIIDSEVWRKMH